MRMNLALRSSARISQSPAIFSRNNLHPRRSGSRSSTICFSSASDAEQSPEMDTAKAQELPKEEENENNVMSSFGEGYSTRSDEEGFGGIYGRNDDDDEALGMKKKEEKETDVHENNHEHDREQGCEVKEKEKSRHQRNVDT